MRRLRLPLGTCLGQVDDFRDALPLLVRVHRRVVLLHLLGDPKKKSHKIAAKFARSRPRGPRWRGCYRRARRERRTWVMPSPPFSMC
jgi:hypothetical protein